MITTIAAGGLCISFSLHRQKPGARWDLGKRQRFSSFAGGALSGFCLALDLPAPSLIGVGLASPNGGSGLVDGPMRFIGEGPGFVPFLAEFGDRLILGGCSSTRSRRPR